MPKLSTVGVGLLLVLSPLGAWAEGPDRPEKDWKESAYIFVALRADGRVEASATLSPIGDDESSQGPEQLSQAMTGFFGAAVKEVPDVDASLFRRFEVIGGVRRDGWVCYVEANPEPVLAFLRKAGLSRLELAIEVEDKQGFSESTLKASASRESKWSGFTHRTPWGLRLGMFPFAKDHFSRFQRPTVYDYEFAVSEPAPPPFRVAYGYRPIDFSMLAPLALLPLPVLWTLRRRRQVFRAPLADPAATWWRYARFIRRLEIGLALAWAFAVVGTPVGVLMDRLAHFAVGMPTEGREFFLACDWLSLAVYALPPATIALLCQYLSYPVYTRIRGVDWTRADVMRHALTDHVLPWFAFLLLACAIAGFGDPGWHRWVSCGLGGVGIALALPVLRGVTGRRFLQPLDSGVIRDRVFELAQRAGVKVNQIYLWPTQRDRAANAAALVGNKVLLTDYMLQHMSKRQVDWVVAHELVHLRHQHVGKAAMVGLWIVLVLVLLLSSSVWAVPLLYPGFQSAFDLLVQVRYGLLLLLLLGIIGVNNFRKRRNELVADNEAVTIVGGDAEAGITALVKLARLNLLPEQWGRFAEKLSTHPSNSRRIQALMDENDIDPARLPAILAAVDQDESRYPLPADSVGDERRLLTDFKARRSLTVLWFLLPALLVFPAMLARAIESLNWHGPTAWAAIAGGVFLSLWFFGFATGYAGLAGEPRLRERLIAKWKGGGFDADASHGFFVALSPARVLRLYESSYDWDFGFLFLTSERLCYLGCQTRFGLSRDQVKVIRPGPGAPRWGKLSRVYLTWRDDKGTETTWNLRPAGIRGPRRLRRQVPELLRALQEWHRTAPAPVMLPEPLSSLPAPAIGKVTCSTVAAYARLHSLPRSLWVYSLFSGGVAFLLGCSFDMVPSLGWGWYAPALTCSMLIFQRIPLWRYREPRPALPAENGPTGVPSGTPVGG